MEVGKDGPPTTVLGTLLARAGFQVLSPDLQYFGERASDKMFTTFTGQEKHEKLYNQPSAYLSWMIQNVKDISRALDFMVQERNADPQRIALVGISRGCRLPLDIGNDDLAVTFELRRHNFGMVGKPEVTRGAASRRNSFASLGTICPWHGSW